MYIELLFLTFDFICVKGYSIVQKILIEIGRRGSTVQKIMIEN